MYLSEAGHAVLALCNHFLCSSPGQSLPLMQQSCLPPMAVPLLLLLQGLLKGVNVLLGGFQNVICSPGMRIDQLPQLTYLSLYTNLSIFPFTFHIKLRAHLTTSPAQDRLTNPSEIHHFGLLPFVFKL